MANPLRALALTALVLFSAALAAAPLPVPSPPQPAARSWLLQDMHSGRVLAEHGIDDPVEPASITKIMTVYAVLHEIRAGNLTLDEQVTVSEKAWRMEGSRMFIEVGTQVDVEALLKGVIIQSGNDASVALAEHVAGDEATFAALMNRHAARLGMSGTHFVNSTGLPHPEHLTTARDIATVSRALIAEFPEYYGWFADREMTYNGIKQHNRNRLLWRDPSVDGIKTGHTESAGYCLASSAERDGMRLIAVVLGADSEQARAGQSLSLLNYGFRFFETHRLYQAGETVTEVRTWMGAAQSVPVGPASGDLWITVPRGRYDQLQPSMEVERQVRAPVRQGQTLGTLSVRLGDEVVARTPLVALRDVPEGDLWQRLSDTVRLWFE
ncbi:MAG: D-alanyl-D-alanine carboxypeptidase family protein [Gammaproteobacteria bacterium]|nr:D-alanyl-D-alanine carboxypeptidase family protein [Gammaproteobacteria bacterium]